MKLTKIERLFLANQYSILEKIDPDNAQDYTQKRTALEEGYELHYGWIFEHLSDGLSTEECSEVLVILNMFRKITFSYKNINDVQIEDIPQKYRFEGFDGNSETEYYSYCVYFITELNRFPELTYGLKYPDLNSHTPMLPTYRKMLKAWETIGDDLKTKDLTLEQIDKILEA